MATHALSFSLKPFAPFRIEESDSYTTIHRAPGKKRTWDVGDKSVRKALAVQGEDMNLIPEPRKCQAWRALVCFEVKHPLILLLLVPLQQSATCTTLMNNVFANHAMTVLNRKGFPLKLQ